MGTVPPNSNPANYRYRNHPSQVPHQQVVMMNQNGQLIQTTARIPSNMVPTTTGGHFLTPNTSMTYVRPGAQPRRVSTSAIPTVNSTVHGTTPPPVKKHKIE